MNVSEMFGIKQPSSLLQALVASNASSFQYQVPTMVPNYSEIDALQRFERFPDRKSSRLQQPSLVGVEGGGLMLPPSVPSPFSRMAKPATKRTIQEDAYNPGAEATKLPPKKRVKLLGVVKNDSQWSEIVLKRDPSQVNTKTPKTIYPAADDPKSETSTEESQSSTTKLANRNVSAEKHWDGMFLRLLVYKAIHGHCIVPKNYSSDPMLGKWVFYQRKRRKRLTDERKKCLQDIGFVFCLKKRESWESMFQKLVDYKNQHGHCMVPQTYKQDKKLGKWVAIQRFNKNTLSKERIVLLNKINFIWSPNKAMWNTMFQSLVQYKEKNGNCRVPYNYEDPQLANWVRRQRQNKEYLSDDCLTRLMSIGFEV